MNMKLLHSLVFDSAKAIQDYESGEVIVSQPWEYWQVIADDLARAAKIAQDEAELLMKIEDEHGK